MINIANSYTEKDFLDTFQAIVDDIPPSVIDDKDDLFSAVFSGLQVNEPEAYSYFTKNNTKLKGKVFKILSTYLTKYKKKNFNNSGDYLAYFRDKMEEWGIDAITDLSDSEKSKFFKEVKAGK